MREQNILTYNNEKSQKYNRNMKKSQKLTFPQINSQMSKK